MLKRVTDANPFPFQKECADFYTSYNTLYRYMSIRKRGKRMDILSAMWLTSTAIVDDCINNTLSPQTCAVNDMAYNRYGPVLPKMILLRKPCADAGISYDVFVENWNIIQSITTQLDDVGMSLPESF